jgi:hypothetical protein
MDLSETAGENVASAQESFAQLGLVPVKVNLHEDCKLLTSFR